MVPHGARMITCPHKVAASCHAMCCFAAGVVDDARGVAGRVDVPVATEYLLFSSHAAAAATVVAHRPFPSQLWQQPAATYQLSKEALAAGHTVRQVPGDLQPCYSVAFFTALRYNFCKTVTVLHYQGAPEGVRDNAGNVRPCVF